MDRASALRYASGPRRCRESSARVRDVRQKTSFLHKIYVLHHIISDYYYKHYETVLQVFYVLLYIKKRIRYTYIRYSVHPFAAHAAALILAEVLF